METPTPSQAIICHAMLIYKHIVERVCGWWLVSRFPWPELESGAGWGCTPEVHSLIWCAQVKPAVNSHTQAVTTCSVIILLCSESAINWIIQHSKSTACVLILEEPWKATFMWRVATSCYSLSGENHMTPRTGPLSPSTSCRR